MTRRPIPTQTQTETSADQPEPLSQADESLRRAIAAKPVTVTPPPSDLIDPVAHRRSMQTLGWG